MAVVVFLMLLRREKRDMKEYFERNGGPILQEVNNIKIFKKEELKSILKSHNIIGKGAFGEVYMWNGWSWENHPSQICLPKPRGQCNV